MLKKIATTFVASSLIFATATANAALPSYMDAVGQKSGHIDGSVTQKGREKSIKVNAVTHDIVSPRDPMSGLPTGQRKHAAISVTIDVDQALPLLYNSMSSNENFPTVTLKFWEIRTGVTGAGAAPGAVGAEMQMYTVKLTNANIAGISFIQPDAENPATKTEPLRAVIQFTYQKIEWTWVPNGKSGSDSWQSRT
jgi:type VI secretion system secreted protein Hcp